MTFDYRSLLARLVPHNVDSILKTLKVQVETLERAEASLVARANRRYEQAAKLDKQGDEDTRNAERAARVRERIVALID